MSLTLWKQRPPHVDRNGFALVRPREQWKQIFREQTDGTPQQAAARIFGDLMCYTASRKQNGFDKARDGFYPDVEQLARALEAYVEYRRGGE